MLQNYLVFIRKKTGLLSHSTVMGGREIHKKKRLIIGFSWSKLIDNNKKKKDNIAIFVCYMLQKLYSVRYR